MYTLRGPEILINKFNDDEEDLVLVEHKIHIEFLNVLRTMRDIK